MPQGPHRPRSLSTGTYTHDHPLSQPDTISFPQRAVVAGPTTLIRESAYLSDMEAAVLPAQVTAFSQTHSSEEHEASESTWIVSAGRYFFSALCMIYTLGICRILRIHMHFKNGAGGTGWRGGGGGGFELQNTGYFDSDHAQWLKFMRRMVAIWRLSRLGCAVLLPLSITLLQIDGVVDTVLARTCTISTAIFAAAGLICSGIFLFMRRQFVEGRKKVMWMEASQGDSSYHIPSIEFWTYMALPVAAMVWAILTCVVTVVCIAWTHHNDSPQESHGAFISSAVFITLLITLTLGYVYKAAEMAIWP